MRSNILFVDMIFMNNTEMTTLSSLLIELSYLIVHGVTSKINTLLIHFMSFLLPNVIAAYTVPLFCIYVTGIFVVSYF